MLQTPILHSEVTHPKPPAVTLGCTSVVKSDLQGQAIKETDGRGSVISPHAAVSCDWPRSCVAGRWQSVLSEQSEEGGGGAQGPDRSS